MKQRKNLNIMLNSMNSQVTTKVLTDDLLIDLLNTTKSTICSITYIVDDSRSKTVKGVKQVQKEVLIKNLYLNHNYANKVNNINDKNNANAEIFVPLELKGKTRISTTILKSDKTNELMIDGKVLNSESSKLIRYIHNNETITEAEAIASELWANAYFAPKEKVTAGRGSLSKEDDFYFVNTYLNKISKIKIFGEVYER
jgi:hypothetical protein